MSHEVVIKAEPLREFAEMLYLKAGVTPEHAKLTAKLQVETDLRNVHSHGTRMLPSYIREIEGGRLNPTPNIRVVQEGPSFAVIDGDGGLGHPPSALAMELAITKARQTGIAAAGVRNAGHFGAAACYAIMAVEQKLIGFATTNTGGPSVAAPGSAVAVTANNALSYSLPAGQERPIVLDMACAVSSWGKVRTMQMYGQPIPPGWLLTAEGEPTQDPTQGRVLLPAAGPRGYGLALTMGILAGPLVGGLLACHKHQGEPSEHFFIAIDVARFTDYETYTAEIDRGIRAIQSAKTAAGVERVYLPGEIEWRKRETWLESGIPIHVDHVQALADVADRLGVEVFWQRP